MVFCLSLPQASAASVLRWTSQIDSNWDLTTTNWLNLATTTPDRFVQGDAVRFDDSGSFAPAVQLVGVLSPSQLTVDSSGIHYSFAGPGRLSGMADGITKNGSSTLTLATSNDFTGSVQIQGGTIKLGDSSALGSASGVTIGNNGTLDLAGFSAGIRSVDLHGAGHWGNGAVVNTGPGLVNDGLRGTNTFLGDVTFGGPNRWEIAGGRVIGNGHKLTKAGASEIVLRNLGETALGEIVVEAGTLSFSGNTSPGDPAKSLFVRPNATLDFTATGTQVVNKTLMLDHAQVRNRTPGGTDITTNSGAVFLSGENTFDVDATIRLRGEVGGLGSIHKTGAGTLAMDNDNFYAGDTVVSSGRLSLGSDGGVGGSPHIILHENGILDSSGLSELFIRSTQHLLGSGSVHGNVIAGPNSTVNPGLGVGTLTITNGLVLFDGSALIVELSSTTTEGAGVNDLVRVGGSLTLEGSSMIRVIPVSPLDRTQPYTLITYEGSLSSSGELTATSDTRMEFAVDTSGTPGKIKLQVTSGEPALAIWAGGQPQAPAAWDVKTTSNWNVSGASDLFYAADTAVFNDLGTVSEIELVGDLHPSQTRVEAAGVDYTFTGSGQIRGGSLTKSLNGKLTIANTGTNDYPGPTVINAGILQVGAGGTAGNLGPGPVTNHARLVFNRSDSFTLSNPISGSGNVDILMPDGLVVDGSAPINLTSANGGGILSIGDGGPGRLVLRTGANLTVGRLTLGGEPGSPGEVIHDDGSLLVAQHLDIGIGPNEISTYAMNGGSLALTNVPTGNATERDGIVYIGVDGTGAFRQTGGIVAAHGIVLDNRANTAGDDAFLLEGGTFNVGASGISNGGNGTNPTYSIGLGGGRLASSASWSSALKMQLTGVNGDATFDTQTHTNTLFGPISGPGGLIKAGSGVLSLSGTNTYSGSTRVDSGTLVIPGPLGTGAGELRVRNGATVFAANRISDAVVIEAGGTLSPGLEPGSIATVTTPNPVQLLGTTRMELFKAAGNVSNDRIVGSVSLTLAGSLEVVATGESLADGDTFTLFQATTFHGAFASVHLPALPFGLNWDLGELATAGRIKVVALRFLSSTVSGNNLQLSASGGTPGSAYRIVASLDLLAPVSSWAPVANGTFDASGSFSLTIPIDLGEPQRYYAIRVP